MSSHMIKKWTGLTKSPQHPGSSCSQQARLKFLARKLFMLVYFSFYYYYSIVFQAEMFFVVLQQKEHYKLNVASHHHMLPRFLDVARLECSLSVTQIQI